MHTLYSQASLPAELGELSNLVYLRLSYNEFTGAVPETLSTIKGLQLLQLQANRITEIPNIPRLNDALYADSTFVADCGVPTDFEYVLKCDNCTMCCKYYCNAATHIGYFDGFCFCLHLHFHLWLSLALYRQCRWRLQASRRNPS